MEGGVCLYILRVYRCVLCRLCNVCDVCSFCISCVACVLCVACVCVCVYLLDESSHVQGCEGSLLGWFDDHSVSTAQSRSYLPGEHHHWEVPLDKQHAQAQRQVRAETHSRSQKYRPRCLSLSFFLSFFLFRPYFRSFFLSLVVSIYSVFLSVSLFFDLPE